MHSYSYNYLLYKLYYIASFFIFLFRANKKEESGKKEEEREAGELLIQLNYQISYVQLYDPMYRIER